jgi:hypothetical protein
MGRKGNRSPQSIIISLLQHTHHATVHRTAHDGHSRLLRRLASPRRPAPPPTDPGPGNRPSRPGPGPGLAAAGTGDRTGPTTIGDACDVDMAWTAGRHAGSLGRPVSPPPAGPAPLFDVVQVSDSESAGLGGPGSSRRGETRVAPAATAAVAAARPGPESSAYVGWGGGPGPDCSGSSAAACGCFGLPMRLADALSAVVAAAGGSSCCCGSLSKGSGICSDGVDSDGCAGCALQEHIEGNSATRTVSGRYGAE